MILDLDMQKKVSIFCISRSTFKTACFSSAKNNVSELVIKMAEENVGENVNEDVNEMCM